MDVEFIGQKIGVVVLNFIKYEETINCVNSLLSNTYTNIEIVVIDNGSGNESVNVLNSQFRDYKNVYVLALDSNIGYAKGNNKGISFLRSKGIENIFIANSDLVFPNSPVLEHMLKFIEEKDAVIVPTIKNPNGSYDQRVIYKKNLFILRMTKELIKSLIKNILGISIKANVNYYISSDQNTKARIYDDCYVVSGSGFMLTKYFFNYYDGLFSKTFLYGEECGTIILMNKAGLNSRVVNTEVIIHKGGASTPESIKGITRERKKINMDSDIKLLKLLFSPPIKKKV